MTAEVGPETPYGKEGEQRRSELHEGWMRCVSAAASTSCSSDSSEKKAPESEEPKANPCISSHPSGPRGADTTRRSSDGGARPARRLWSRTGTHVLLPAIS